MNVRHALAMLLCFLVLLLLLHDESQSFSVKMKSNTWGISRPSSALSMKSLSDSVMNKDDLTYYAELCGLSLKVVEGPAQSLRLEAYPLNNPDIVVGYLTAFIRPLPFKLFHLDTIQVKNQRQNVGYKRSQDSWTIDGPGISFIMGSYALAWAYEKGCKKTELLAVKDTEQMHKILIRLYQSFGFVIVREVGDNAVSIPDRLLWGAVGTLMEMDIPNFMSVWTPKLKGLMKMMEMKSGNRSVENKTKKKSAESGDVVKSVSTPGMGSAEKDNKPLVALTRERGANAKMFELLSDVDCIELPCIAFISQETNKQALLKKIQAQAVDVVILTSPQAAQTFLSIITTQSESDDDNDKLLSLFQEQKIQIASVGKGTSKPLIKQGIAPSFEPSDSTGKTLATELPFAKTSAILYAASALADNTIETVLSERGFSAVDRINTYETIPAPWSEVDYINAKETDIVTFASPSTIKVWADRVGTNYTVVVIGPTSQKAAEKMGFKQVICPTGGSKGVESWARSVRETVQSR